MCGQLGDDKQILDSSDLRTVLQQQGRKAATYEAAGAAADDCDKADEGEWELAAKRRDVVRCKNCHRPGLHQA